MSNNIIDNLQLNWIGIVKDLNQTKKVWGQLINKNERRISHYYIFFGVIGKKLTFIKHQYTTRYIDKSLNKKNTLIKHAMWYTMRRNMKIAIKKKRDRAYVPVNLDYVLHIWPEFLNQLNNEYVAHKLTNDFD